MQKIYNFNGLILQSDLNNFNFLKKKNYGFGKKLKNYLLIRFEKKNISDFLILTNLQKNVFMRFLFKVIPEYKKVKEKQLINICIFDFLHIYKGWRHWQGLPVNGQRTWSNAWSTYKTNLLLRQFKLDFFKKNYNNASLYEVNLAIAAEQYNLLWKLQWEDDWIEAKKKRLNILKNKNAFIKVDLNGMARGQITKLGKVAKVGKKKREIKKNVFNLGFDVGFTKKLFELKKNSKFKNSQIQLLSYNKKK